MLLSGWLMLILMACNVNTKIIKIHHISTLFTKCIIFTTFITCIVKIFRSVWGRYKVILSAAIMDMKFSMMADIL
jgi:hypothetical protein